MQWTESIWPTKDHSCEVWSKPNQWFRRRCCLKELFTHARTQTHDGRWTKCDHKSSPCHYVTGELKSKTYVYGYLDFLSLPFIFFFFFFLQILIYFLLLLIHKLIQCFFTSADTLKLFLSNLNVTGWELCTAVLGLKPRILRLVLMP